MARRTFDLLDPLDLYSEGGRMPRALEISFMTLGAILDLADFFGEKLRSAVNFVKGIDSPGSDRQQ